MFEPSTTFSRNNSRELFINMGKQTTSVMLKDTESLCLKNVEKSKAYNLDNVLEVDLSKFIEYRENGTFSAGVLPKWWIILNDVEYLAKVPSINNQGEFNLESITECVVSDLCKMLGLPHAEYDPLIINYIDDVLGKSNCLGCISKNFLKPGEALHSAYKLGLNKFFGDYVDAYSYLNLSKDVGMNFAGMAFIDFMIQNPDRHTKNFGLVVGNDCRRFAPIFDSGAGFFSQDDESNITKLKDSFFNKGLASGRDGNKRMLDTVAHSPYAFYVKDLICKFPALDWFEDGLNFYRQFISEYRVSSILDLVERRLAHARTLFC